MPDMELADAISSRRMVRSYDPHRPVPGDLLRACLDAATRAPSAGFTQGWDFVVLDQPEDVRLFWELTTAGEAPDSWLAGMMTAPALVVCCSDPEAYLERYARPDKGWTDRDPARWPIPYWDVDTGMAAMLALLTAVDSGLGACFFGVPTPRHTAVKDGLAIPADRRIVGVISLGYAAPLTTRTPRSPSRPRRREVAEVVHWGRFGGSATPGDAAVSEDSEPPRAP